MRTKAIAIALATAALSIPASAFADPDFGPGGSSKGPHDGGATCHEPAHGTGPGPLEPVPGCKG